MLSWFRFHRRVNSSLIEQRKRMNQSPLLWHMPLKLQLMSSFDYFRLYHILPTNQRRCSVLLVYQCICWLVPPSLSEVIFFYRGCVQKTWDATLREKKSSATLVHILSHENLAVWPFSKEVFWSLSFPGGSFGFIINCPVQEETSGTNGHADMLAHTHLILFPVKKQTDPSTRQFNEVIAVPFFHKAWTTLVFPAVPVLLCVEDMLSKDDMIVTNRLNISVQTSLV